MNNNQKERRMDIATLLWADIIAIISIPVSILLFNSAIAIIGAGILTMGLIYLDIMTYKKLKQKPLPIS